jgi:hypothetical protein
LNIHINTFPPSKTNTKHPFDASFSDPHNHPECFSSHLEDPKSKLFKNNLKKAVQSLTGVGEITSKNKKFKNGH